MATLTERFAVELEKRDRAVDILNRQGYAALEAESGGADFDREDRAWAVIVVRSADDVENPTNDVRQAFATAVGELLDTDDILWRLVPWPGPSTLGSH